MVVALLLALASPQLGLHAQPCVQGHSKVAAECGTFGVYENRAAGSGRIIQLHLILLKAAHPAHRAIAFIAGGPGESATPFASAVADGVFEKGVSTLRDRYDVLFVDNRGMGRSNPFACIFTPPKDPASYFRQLWPDKLVSACRKASAAMSDPGQYNTNNAVDDLNDVRAAFGYPKLVLYGGSYGTFFSMVYLRRHPTHVESAVLDAVDAPHFQALPGEPVGAQTALDDLVRKCRRDPVCNKHFPQFGKHFSALVRRFDDGPLMVPVKTLALKTPREVKLSKEVFVDQLRHTLYDPQSAAYIPYVVERAYHFDYAALAQFIDTISQLLTLSVNNGAYLSYSCADLMPFVDEAQVKAAAAHSFAGDLRVRAQQRACALWNVPPMPASFNDAVRSDAPVLMISATDDPVTPPRYAEEALRYLPNGKEVLVQGAGHATETPCTDRLIVQFVTKNSAKGLPVAQCTTTFHPPPFATSMKGLPTL